MRVAFKSKLFTVTGYEDKIRYHHLRNDKNQLATLNKNVNKAEGRSVPTSMTQPHYKITSGDDGITRCHGLSARENM